MLIQHIAQMPNERGRHGNAARRLHGQSQVMVAKPSAPTASPERMPARTPDTVATAGILGIPFAIAKTVSAFAIGLLAGGITAALPGFSGPGHRFMRADQLAAARCCTSTVIRLPGNSPMPYLRRRPIGSGRSGR